MDSEKLKNLQKTFLHDEIWLLSYIGAFGRANIYAKDALEKKRIEFRKYLRETISAVVQEKYQQKVSSQMHTEELIRIKDAIPAEHLKTLRNGTFRLGVMQKLMNLYLKYLWSLGWISDEPPHCPFDGNIIKKLELDVAVVRTWTKIIERKDYEKLVVAAQKKAAPLSIAEWELQEFNRIR